MTMHNVISFANATAATFPALEKTGFNAAFQTLYQADGSPVPHAIGRAVVRTDTNAPLGIVGTNYGIAQNPELREQVIESAERALPREFLKGITLSEKVSGGGAFTRFEFTFPNAAQPIRQYLDQGGVRVRDTLLNFKISVVNSFGGKTPVIAQAGAVDLVCTNGMVAAIYDTSKKRHTSGFNPEFFGAFLEEQAREYFERIRVWQAWAEKRITPEQAEQTLKAAGMSERLTNKFMHQFERESAERGRTVWALYSAATFYSSHNSEMFAVRNAANADNVAETLYKREADVSRLITSAAWRNLAGVAA